MFIKDIVSSTKVYFDLGRERHVIYKNDEQHWGQTRSLGNTSCDCGVENTESERTQNFLLVRNDLITLTSLMGIFN